jgi:hypothetical protein
MVIQRLRDIHPTRAATIYTSVEIYNANAAAPSNSGTAGVMTKVEAPLLLVKVGQGEEFEMEEDPELVLKVHECQTNQARNRAEWGVGRSGCTGMCQRL